MANVILDGAEAAVAQIHLETSPPPELLADLRAGVPDILDLSIVALKG